MIITKEVMLADEKQMQTVRIYLGVTHKNDTEAMPEMQEPKVARRKKMVKQGEEIMLSKIQAELKAPKGQTNTFGKYKYRSMEDINEAVKPILTKYNMALVISDEIVLIGERYYVKATASILLEGETIASACGYAREEESKKGMDSSQITGSCSSYARKYAANGLFAIDDTKDADHSNTHGKDVKMSSDFENKADKTKAADVIEDWKSKFKEAKLTTEAELMEWRTVNGNAMRDSLPDNVDKNTLRQWLDEEQFNIIQLNLTKEVLGNEKNS